MSNYALSKGTVLRNKSLIGRESTYTIEKVLGQGGFGITYLASQMLTIGNVRHKVHYAIKEFFVNKLCWRDEDSIIMKYSPAAKEEVEECRKDFLDEAYRLNKICSKNKNIVNVNEVFESNNTAYYVMEFLSGGSLRDCVLSDGAMSEPEALSFLLPIAEAVTYLHSEHRLLHCDISPDNIMLRASESGMPVPVLIDFGESLHFNSKGDLTTTHTAVGAKEGYAPQEQYQGVKEFDARVDVYALSATLFYLLTGHRPLSAFDMSNDYLEKNLPEGLSPSVRDTIIHGLAKDKEMRTATVTDLVSELTTGKHPVAVPDKLRVGYLLNNGQKLYKIVSFVGKTSSYIHYKAIIGNKGEKEAVEKTKKFVSQCDIYEFFSSGIHHRNEDGTLSTDGDTSVVLQEYLKLCGEKTGDVISRQFQTHSGPGWATFEANDTYYLVWTKVKKQLPWKKIVTYSAGAVSSVLLVWSIMTIVRSNNEANERERKEMSMRLSNAIATNDSAALREFALVLDSAKAYLPYADICLSNGDFETALVVVRKTQVPEVAYMYKQKIDSLTQASAKIQESDFHNAYAEPQDITQIVTYPDDDSQKRANFKGIIKDGNRIEGKLVWKNGDSFEGSFDNDNLSEGTLTFKKDGTYYKGSFKNNKPHDGTLYNKNGTILMNIKNGRGV